MNLVQRSSASQFIISRLWRSKELIMPTSRVTLEEGDRILVVTTEKDVEALTILFGDARTATGTTM
mgnify:CR=1 FL=1